MDSRAKSNLYSLAIHAGVIAVLFSAASNREVRGVAARAANAVVPLIAPYLSAPKPAGGGGGDRSPIPASKGALPKLAPRQFTPPMAVRLNPNPKLVMEPTLVATAEITLPQVNLPVFGDPLGASGPQSNGSGSGGGIGTGQDGGIGPGRGPGYGPGDGGRVGGNPAASSLHGSVTPAALLWSEEPEYSDEARKARLQGTVVLVIEVGANGKARNVRVQTGLGLGLDEKAMAAVSKWKFRPAYRDGKPVPSPALIEVNFRLL